MTTQKAVTRLPAASAATATTARTIRRAALVSGSLLALLLGGCDTVGDWFGKTPEPPLPGNRVSILQRERKVEPDPQLASVSVVVPEQAANAAWAQPGGTPEHAMGNLALSANPAEAWRTDVGAGSSSSRALLATPVIADGRIYAMDADSHVSAFNERNGQSLWRVDTRPEQERGSATGGGVAYADGRVYAATGFAEVLALEAGSGKVLWRKRIAGPVRGAPTVSGGRVMVVTLDNQLVALSVDDGAVQWSHQGILETAGLLGAASPAATSTLVVAPYSSGELYGLRPENGRVGWQESLAAVRRTGALSNLADIRGLPVIDRGVVYAIGHSGRMVAIDERIGSRIWETEIGGVQTPWAAGDFLFVVTNDQELVAVARQTGRIRWVSQLDRFKDPEDKKGPIVWSGPVLAGSRLWVASSDGKLLGLSPADGRVEVTRSLPTSSYLPPVAANNTLYVLCDNGTLVAFR
ncbi:outer membrane protein assembly factor BamB family protein [Azospirillum picis]|uniref:Outer membrane protein assembly factor BamB n=1 Tax=Azospirillum picis TaxID=488438 RepID=A0ABU0MFT2_9PROT|nr:PQQ-like beta-propeller repeat protein [Azospirillum picis]MBP2298656.1 outer membrane protein assembly factor BamB [Azospirillum picis]MDQ0532295.1 outer membrane protein assembly factor BamB [Azospirillum picis]